MTTPSEASTPLRWAIIGTGGIAGMFADDLRLSGHGELVAVGSRSARRAEAFAAKTGAARFHGDHDELLAAGDIDAVYVAVPHSAHRDVAVAAIEAGKAVLVEKPFTVNRAQAEELVKLARSNGVFQMEAMWTRFLPHMVRVRELLAQGRLGDVRQVNAELGVWFEKDPAHRMFDRTWAAARSWTSGSTRCRSRPWCWATPRTCTGPRSSATPGWTGRPPSCSSTSRAGRR
nr:Gfo/Idh/MocA family oxidoreductase [Sphaerisporangium album]